MSTILLPASPQTLFTYEVRNDKIVWVDVPQTFKENLLNVDEIMPAILAEMLLLVHHHGCICKVDELCEELTADDPLHLDTRYRLKIQRFLEGLALGMTPHEAWDGNINIPPHFRIGAHTFPPPTNAHYCATIYTITPISNTRPLLVTTAANFICWRMDASCSIFPCKSAIPTLRADGQAHA